jgi:glycogen(starch) synthase
VRILTVSWEYPPVVYGGLGRHVHALAEAQAAAGHEVTVLTQHVEGAARDEVVRGVRVVRVPFDPPVVPRGDLLAWVLALGHGLARAGLRVAHETRPEVVHAHDWVTCHAATALKEGLGLPLVATVHATEAGRHQGWLPNDLSRAIHTTEWWLTFETRRVITCSEHMRWEVTRLFDLPPHKVDVLPNGIDTARWSPPEHAVAAARARFAGAGPLLVFAGRLEWEKGLQTVLASMPRLTRRFPGARLVVAGQGTHERELRALARRKRLGRSVEFAGFLEQEQLAALVGAADVAVVPSIYEPFGLAALEAAAAGTPLVVADTGGLREFVEHDVTGLRFAPGDEDGLVRAVSDLLSDEVLGRRLVRSGRALLADEHGWPGIAERTVEVYRRAAVEERALQAGLAARAERPLRVVVRDGNLLTGEIG